MPPKTTLAALERPARETGSRGRRVDRDRVHDAAAHLLDHVDETVTLERSARVAGLSPFHFLRVFRRELGLTGVFVTHDVLEALSLGDRIAVLHEGCLRALGTPEALRDSDDAYVRGLLDAPRRALGALR